MPKLDESAVEHAALALIIEIARTNGRSDLVAKVQARGVEEAREYMAKHPDFDREVRATIRAYLLASGGK